MRFYPLVKQPRALESLMLHVINDDINYEFLEGVVANMDDEGEPVQQHGHCSLTEK
ncbi:hypothetical protein A2U01_0059626, partial [Trifolium medium]|nr:hypothetical protein [Trifolium medium]